MINCKERTVLGHDISPTLDSIMKTIIPLLKYDIPKIVPSINYGEHAWNDSSCLQSHVQILLINQNTAHWFQTNLVPLSLGTTHLYF